MNNFIVNITGQLNSIIALFDQNNCEFDRIETSQRGGGKSVYIYFTDKTLGNDWEYSIRISDHELGIGYYSYTNVGKILSTNGIFDLPKSIKSNIVELRQRYLTDGARAN